MRTQEAAVYLFFRELATKKSSAQYLVDILAKKHKISRVNSIQKKNLAMFFDQRYIHAP